MPSTSPGVSQLLAATRAAWALLIGIAILMLGDGLQGTLLAVRASQEAFPTTLTGLIMSTFYVGFLAGALYAPRIVERVGHVRVFGALASMASASVLIHGVFVTPLVWCLLRLISGFCLAGIYVVAESWLNERATNETRGQLLSVYMVVTYAGVGAGQLLLNLADPLGLELFILTSVLISVALVPLLLSAGPTPHFAEISVVSVGKLYRISPLGVVGAVGTGMAAGALFGIGPVYAESSGLSLAQISVFMLAAVTGCIALQWPIGHLSDRFDRRRVVTAVTLVAAVVALVAVPAAKLSTPALMLLVALFGGLSLPLYSLCIAHANDYLEPEQMVAASGGLVLASGIGAILGPITASAVMSLMGDDGFFFCLAAVHGALGLFAIHRMVRRRARPVDDQASYAPTTPRSSWVTVEAAQHTMHDADEPGDI